MVTVVIPVLNEENTIGQVIRLVRRSPLVSEVLVIDDKSLDRTIQIAKNENARVVTSTRLGKGASMREGALLSKNDTVVYLDGDIINYPSDIIEKLAGPILDGSADLVKSKFTRQAGRVTELVAKPLISILIPALKHFEQPLSGMIAARKDLLNRIEFENDYGVDIGILIDAFMLDAKILEVNIGSIENRMQDLKSLGKMSREVSRAILKRVRHLPDASLDSYDNIQQIREQMDFAISESLLELNKMVVFDMDNTILKASFISTAAKKFGFVGKLETIAATNHNAFVRTKKIAHLLKDKSIADILDVVDSIPVVDDLPGVVSTLKKRGFVCGIISDSYDCVTNHVKNKIGFDFSLGNELEFSAGIATGEVKIPSFFTKNRKSLCEHDYCKGNVLRHIANRYNIDLSDIVSIGDGENDVCMLKMSGVGISFCATHHKVNVVADRIFSERSFKPLLEIAF